MKKFTSTYTSHRRSSRRRQSAVKPSNTKSQRMSGQGFFEKLPAEVFDLILNHLSAVEASVFSMVSKSISNCIIRHLSTSAWRNQMILQKFHCTSPKAEHLNTILDHFRSLGLLFKRCTLLLPTKERLKFIYNTFSQIPCFRIEQCDVLPLCQGFACYGVFLQTLIAGWDELECQRVFNFLCKTTHLQWKIEAAVASKPGTCYRLELEVRFFCRGVMFDQWKNRRDAHFWLTCILRPWPIISQARLLFILFGPLQSDGKLGWQDVRDGAVVHGALWDLAKAIILLYGNTDNKSWSTDTILAIINEIMVMPQPWHMENVARLLILCGNNICYNVLASKAINGRLFEISRLLIFLILVSEKDGYCMNWVVKMIQQVCQVFSVALEKRAFIERMENMFSEVTMELVELVMAGHRNGELDTALRSLNSLLIANAHFHTEIVCIFLKKE
ncbi:F-box only protein 47 [Pangasianodon hypophthalmus]|uniref:F-box only protein 47 n=1 Tax=Pangasianodon hypophthalmus TaxID=310915 RepID=UPI000EFF8FA5|nr:F-box only protein 47 [Pangasianodon hypophthalmus]